MNSQSSTPRGRSRREQAATPPRSDRGCDRPGCAGEGLYRAPKNRDSLREYFWFCLDHVREYNRAWDFCRGMSQDQIEAMIREDIVGGRPTWPLGWAGSPKDERKIRMDDPFGFFEAEAQAEAARKAAKASQPKSEADIAMDTLGLTAPLTWQALRARYKELVKKFHPDANGGDTAAEEKLKSINQAYATLKSALGAV